MSWFRWWVFGVLVTTLLGTPVHDIGGDALWVTGYNQYFQLGDTVTDDTFREIALPENCLIKQIYTNPTVKRTFLHCVDGRLFVAGSNDHGELCLGTKTDGAPFTQLTLPDGKTLKGVATGSDQTILWMTDDSLYACGLNSWKVIFPSGQPNWLLSPTLLTSAALPANRTIVQMQVGSGSAVLRLDNGDLYGIGSNNNGAIGLGFTTASTSEITQIPLPTGRTATAIAMTLTNLAVILDDGSLATCGYGLYGSNGDGTTTIRYSLAKVALPGTGRRAASLMSGGYGLFVCSTDAFLNNPHIPLPTHHRRHQCDRAQQFWQEGTANASSR
ncbi:hypothetical protein PAPYR_8379 [Paratrimastix pyriformis]|uniref:Uncharacterized protein n=1 Tax=Paratrimastix pyriformis TaxID=342808 RepID=A0ABQ8UDG3_9EUKA|nr:hypothetical protein PAPYR_8379 [Paratrimastix pyriformis]